MSDKKLTRRQFLERAALLGAVTVGAGSLLSACDPPDAEDQPDDQAADDFSCNDDAALEGLSDEEIAFREESEYTDQSTVDGEYCHNCTFWEDPEGGEDCGGCLHPELAGPYHPDGWCNHWAPAG